MVLERKIKKNEEQVTDCVYLCCMSSRDGRIGSVEMRQWSKSNPAN